MEPKRRGRRAGAGAPGPLHRTRQLAEKCLRGSDQAVVSQAELEAATNEIDRWIGKIEDAPRGTIPGIWAAVGHDSLPALHALYALALRRSCVTLTPQLSDSMRIAWAGLRSKLSFELGALKHDQGVHMTFDCMRSTAHAVLCSQALRCHAVLLSDAAAQLTPSPPPPPSQQRGPQAQPRRPHRRSMQAAAVALAEARQPLGLCHQVMFSTITGMHEERHGRAGAGGEVENVDISLLRDLGEELVSSGLLEHWSRLLLLLSACEGWADRAAGELYEVAHIMEFLDSFPVPDWQHDQRDVLLSSPCLSYLLSSHVVGLCAALDGRPTYGMPAAGAAEADAAAAAGWEGAAAAAVAPVFGATGLRLRLRGSPEGAGTDLANWALSVWSYTIQTKREELFGGSAEAGSEDGDSGTEEEEEEEAERPKRSRPRTSLRSAYLRSLDTAQQHAPSEPTGANPDLSVARSLAAAPPLHTVATFELCMRLAEAAAGSLAAGEAAPAGAAGARGRERTGAPRIALDWAADLAARALQCGRQALGDEVFLAAEVGPRAAARMRRWWAALGAMVDSRVAAGCEPVEWMLWMGKERYLVVSAPEGTAGLPDRPSPCVAAALDAGYLPRLTSVLQSLTSNPALLQRMSLERTAWGQLLAFGPPHEAAMLVRCVAQLLREAVNAVRLGGGAPHQTDIDRLYAVVSLAPLLSSDTVNRWLVGQESQDVCAPARGSVHGAAPRLQLGDDDGRPQDAAGAPRLWLMLSYIAAHLLPRVHEALFSCLLPVAARFEPCQPLAAALHIPLLTWATLLAARLRHAADRAMPGAGEAASTAGEPRAALSEAASAAGGSRAASSEVGEWRAMLTRQLPAVLGSSLGIVAAGKDHQGRLLTCLRGALLHLAFLCPLELGQALASQRAQAAVTFTAAAMAGRGSAAAQLCLTVRDALDLALEGTPDVADSLVVQKLMAPGIDQASAGIWREMLLDSRGGDDEGAARLAATAGLLLPPSSLERVKVFR